MKWPLVPRSVHDDVVTDLRKRLDESERRRQELTETIIDLKVTGASIPRIVTTGRHEQKPRDLIEKAVDDNPLFRADPRLRRRQIAWARKAVADGADSGEVIAQLEAFGTVVRNDDDDDDEEMIA